MRRDVTNKKRSEEKISMRHNQNARRMRGNGGRSGGTNHSSGGGQQHHHHSNNGQQRRVNPRVQTFDSNGPEVRIRGTAYQINEKYVTLARDATSAGDRVLAESYLQHAEHYQRFINEMTEEFNQYQQQNPQHQSQPVVDGNGAAPAQGGQQPTEALSDLDQGFLVGPRHGNNSHGNNQAAQPAADGNGATVQHSNPAPQQPGAGEQPREEGPQQSQPRRRQYAPRGETEAV
jgi:hypothetical protein